METKEKVVSACAQQVLHQVRKAVVGKDQQLMWVLAVILSKGHILLEDIPGVGKTTMAVAFSKVLNLNYGRVQFTPDVLPSDITGYSIPDGTTGRMQYKPGAILCNLFLADELNRATSRTQSALLEAMEEGQVTVDGVAHKLPQPFIVIATQNPTGAAGTQLLPDSQMDRFTMRTSLGYPKPEDEKAMVLQRQGKNPMETLEALLQPEQLVQLQEVVAGTYMKESIVEYVVRLIAATRHHPQILRGASPRATLSVVAVSKAIAQLRGRDYVVPKDVQDVFLRIISHRLLIANSTQNQEPDCQQILAEIVSRVEAPAV